MSQSRTPTRRRLRPVVALLALALVAGACNRTPDDPQEAVRQAVAATFEDSYHFEVTVEADPAALRAMGAEAAQSAAFLSGLALEGDVAGDTNSLTVRILGIEALELRRLGSEAVYVRAAAQQFLAAAGQAALAQPATVAAALDQLQASPALRAGVTAALEGRWVGIAGDLDAAAIERALGVESSADGGPDEADILAALGGDLEGAIERYVAVEGEPVDVGGVRRYTVSLALRDLLRNVLMVQAEAAGDDPAQVEADLVGLAERVPGTIDVRDGRVTAIRIDIAGAVEDQPTVGAIEVIVDLSRHGDVDALSVPEGAVTVPSDEFLDTFARLVEFAGTPLP